MGYDTTIEAFDENMCYYEEIISDVSFRSVKGITNFARLHSLKNTRFCDILCEKKVALEYLKYINQAISLGYGSDISFDWNKQLAQKIANDDNIAYFGIYSV